MRIIQYYQWFPKISSCTWLLKKLVRWVRGQVMIQHHWWLAQLHAHGGYPWWQFSLVTVECTTTSNNFQSDIAAMAFSEIVVSVRKFDYNWGQVTEGREGGSKVVGAPLMYSTIIIICSSLTSLLNCTAIYILEKSVKSSSWTRVRALPVYMYSPSLCTA